MKVQNDATSRLLIKCFMPFLLMKYMFHYYFFYRYKKYLPLVEDWDNESRVYALPLFSQSRGFLSRIIIILWAFHNDPYFITLFYRRLSTVTGHWRLLNAIKPDKSDLHLECWSIGRNFQMFHPFSTIINCRSIGDNFSFRNNTTIGNKYDDNSKTPIIGSNVTIGANVVVFGDIRIGNNVTIGAGAVVNKDIPDNSVAYGNPLKIVAKNI